MNENERMFQKQLRDCGTDVDNLNAYNEWKPTSPKVQHLMDLINLMFQEDLRILTVAGKQGSGKTFTVAAGVQNRLKEDFCNNKLLTEVARFLTHAELDMAYKECMNPKATKTQTEVYRTFSSIPILVVDEVGRGSWSEYSEQFIENVISKRYANRLKTILITNKTVTELAKMFDANIIDRMSNSKTGCVFALDGETQR